MFIVYAYFEISLKLHCFFLFFFFVNFYFEEFSVGNVRNFHMATPVLLQQILKLYRAKRLEIL